MTRGIGSALLVHTIKLAAERGKRLVADFIDTGKNRVMYITYKLMGFEEISEDGEKSLLQYSGNSDKAYAPYLKFKYLLLNKP
jgi:hypothetical protein